MYQEQLTKFAKNVRTGFANGSLERDAMGLTRAEFMVIYRKKQKDNFEGNVPFYVCNLCLDFLRRTPKEKSDCCVDESIFYCASIAITAKLGVEKKFDKNIFYTLDDIANM